MNDYLTRDWQLQPQGWTGAQAMETQESRQGNAATGSQR
jgi:hypothetical protein